MGFPSVLGFAHKLAGDAVRPGDFAIDATAGGGNDTVFLARRVGPGGTVYAIDIQAEALKQTEARLAREGLAGTCVRLLQGSHHRMAELLPVDIHGSVAAVMFNLGYLPGGDHLLITRTETTLPALDTAAALLRPGGMLTCVVYPGHEGGGEEADAVEEWAAGLDPKRFQAMTYGMINRRNRPPFLIAVLKTAAGDRGAAEKMNHAMPTRKSLQNKSVARIGHTKADKHDPKQIQRTNEGVVVS